MVTNPVKKMNFVINLFEGVYSINRHYAFRKLVKPNGKVNVFLKYWLNLNLMRAVRTYAISRDTDARRKVLHWIQKFAQFCVLESNTLNNSKAGRDKYGGLDCIVAIGAHSELVGIGHSDFERLQSYVDETNDWVFGYLTYDLKNQLENLKSDNPDYLKFPTLHFFQPEIIVEVGNEVMKIRYLEDTNSAASIDKVFKEILASEVKEEKPHNIEVAPRISKDDYLRSVNKLKHHISYGDIYEVNFCQEFYADSVQVAPLPIYERLNDISRAPFASFYRHGPQYLVSASPERFMKKTGNTLISQPIKGTRRRGATAKLDLTYKAQLAQSEKERSENVMIVDIVRNDLAKSAIRGSVEVSDLFGIYTFEQVHQMISTVTCECRDDIHPIEAIKAAFPMGSMTGAPKIRAMELIEQYESVKRGLFSGAVGYVTPEGDFDFNVVIRSIIYNAEKAHLSFMVGGAITDKADAESEYEECMVKARAMLDVLKTNEVLC
jgi:para-aminobenzoate synthetase component 1